MRFWIRNLLNRDCASAPILLVLTLYNYLNGERNIKLFQAVYVSVRTILAFLLVTGGLFLEPKPCIFWPPRYTSLGW